jgi:anthranilate synthase component 1
LLSSCVHRGDPAGPDAAYARAITRIDELHEAICSAPATVSPPLSGIPVDVPAHDREANLSRAGFQDRVRQALDYIVAGDIFQVQVSRRFALPLQADPFDVYVALRAINPSPYMIYIATPDCTLVGASPEMLVQVTGKRVRYHPIAGTRRRGRTPEDDARMERELRASDKEAAEHLMLIDLGRNDLGRVCATGSVRVTQHMEVERYSHVMHLVSSIEATLDSGCTSLDALRSCFPAGTVTGAPKIRAMEIIAELEPEIRGPYAGAIGYVGYGGDLDTAIALRTIVVREGIAYVQAAAGIVADSSAAEETVEIDNKVAAQILAVEEANAWARR